MSQPSTLTETPAGAEQVETAPARLRGQWLTLVRAACLGVSLVALLIWVWGLPLRYAQLGTVCTVPPASCGDQQITPEVFQRFTAAGVPLSFYSAYFGTVEILYALAYLAMGALVFWRKSETRIGLLTAVLLITYGVGQTDGSVVATSVPALAIPANLLTPVGFICLVLFLYLFPDGRFAPRWTRWVVFAWIPLFLVVSFISIGADLPILYGFLLVSLGVQIYRYQRLSSPIERQQTKWVVFGALLGLLGSGSIIVAGLLFTPVQVFGLWGIFVANTLIYVFSACIPLSIGWAILRSRLWDIDTLINRALVYGSLTGLLGMLYAGLIIGLEHLTGLIAGQAATQPIPLVLSTLAIAALFTPLRHRLQSLIDHRFYRKKYDADKTLMAFNATLRSEVDLEHLRAQVLVVANETMQPAYASLWLCPPARQLPEQAHHLEMHGKTAPESSKS